MYAIIETGGKQYTVKEKDIIYVEKLDAEENASVTFEKVLMADGKIGTPTLEGAKVTATVLKQGKEKKVVTYKYKSKKHQHQKKGHRQPYTKVEINAIEA